MKILITGGGGFIGSSLIVNLPKNYEIICLSHSANYDKLKKFIKGNVKLIDGDITDKYLVDKLMKDVDVVLHFAGGGGTAYCLRDPVKAILTNIYGTHILIKSAIKYKVKRFVFSSSYLAYSVFKERKLPFKEEDKLEPDDFYGALKTIGEVLVKDFPNYTILRFSTIYGYSLGFGSQLEALLFKLIESANNEGTVKIKGSGNQKFDLLHINDLCKALKIVVKNDLKNEIINLGGGKPISINEVALEIKKVFKNEFNKDVKIEHIKDKNYKEWPDHWMSIDKAKKLLKWEPKISLYDDIKDTAERFLK